MDQIKIKDLEVYGHHGVFKEENVLGQKFLVSVDLYTDISHAGNTDQLKYSIDYGKVSHFIKDFMISHTFQLIEAVAENLALHILRQFSLVEQIRLEIKKPWAPILLPLDTVSVEITRGWKKAYLSIGSNLGDKSSNLNKAITMLNEDKDCKVTKQSPFIVTKPVGGVEQDDFLNGALEIKTLRSPKELLSLICEIEKKLKRIRAVHWGPRTIDLDIIFYEGLVISTEELTVPHKEMQNRGFVLEPLVSIAPEIIHPLLGETVFQLFCRWKEGA